MVTPQRFSNKLFSQVPCRRCLLLIHSKFTYLETDRVEDISILDIDEGGDVDVLTDGLLLLRSMFGFEVGALTTEATSPEFTECDATCTLRSLSN